MIIDYYNFDYSPKDLKVEWKYKIKQFKELQVDVPQYHHAFIPLISLTEFIAQSNFATQLFPGRTIGSQLIISPVKEQKVIRNIRMSIRGIDADKMQFTLSLKHENIFEEINDYTGEDLIQFFQKYVDKLTSYII